MSITIQQYAETKNGKALRKLLRSKYIKRKTVKTSEALAFLCVSEVYYCLFEGSIKPDDYYLPEGFEDIPPKDVLEGFDGWATSDYCSDILVLSNEDYRYEEFGAALRFAWETWFDEDKDPYKANKKPKGKTKHVVNIHDIKWDTDDWDCELSEGPHSANVPDLPSEIEEAEIEWDSEYDADDAICKWLSDKYGFSIKSLTYDEPDNPDFHDEFGEKVEK